jgi:hypothetical protein
MSPQDDDPVRKRANEIHHQLAEAEDVRGRDEVCLQNNISQEEFDELYIAYRISYEAVGLKEIDDFNTLAVQQGAITKDEAELSKTNDHQWVLNRIKMRLVMDKRTESDGAERNPEQDDVKLFGILFPEMIGPFVRGEVTDYESTSSGLGYSIAYDSPLGAATVYIYDKNLFDIPEGPTGDLIRDEFDNGTNEVLEAVVTSPSANIQLIERYGTGEPDTGPEFLCAEFEISDEDRGRRTFLFLTGHKDKFIKLRISLNSNDDSEPTARNFADTFAGLLWSKSEHLN